MAIPASEISSLSVPQLRNKYGDVEIQNTLNLIDQIGIDAYRNKYGSSTDTRSMGDRDAIIPYDPASGLFSLNNLSALVRNLPGNAVDTYGALANMVTDPGETLNTLFSKEGASAIWEDLKHQVTNPSETLVERPFETLLNLAPVVGPATSRVAKVSSIGSSLAKLENIAPKTYKALRHTGEFAVDPLGKSAKATFEGTKGLLKALEIGGFRIPATVASGMKLAKIGEVTETTRGFTDQQKVAATPMGRLTGKGVGETRYQTFMKVLKGVKDEEIVLTEMMDLLDQEGQQRLDTYTNEFPQILDETAPVTTDPTTGAPVSIADQGGTKLDINDLIESFKTRLASHNVHIKDGATKINTKIVNDPVYVNDRGANVQLIGESTTREIPIMVRQLGKLSDDVLARSEFRGIPSSEIHHIDAAITSINDYLKTGNVLSPRELFTLHNNIRNVIEYPKKGASVIDAALMDFSSEIRKKLSGLPGKTEVSNKSFDDLMKEVEKSLVWENSVRKAWGLYRDGSENAGAVLRKIAAGGSEAAKYRKELLARGEARGMNLGAALEAMEFRGWEPKGLVGRQMAIGILGAGAAFGAVSWWPLMGIPFAAPRIVGNFAAKIGVSKRAADYLTEIVKEMHNNYPTAVAMGKQGYTIGGILANHADFAREARQRDKAGEE
tara:strand:- start:941 stop:2941 length:2001 start_codon:yes stop_codon:yes gene_type:complete